jgi:hypothetical protein
MIRIDVAADAGIETIDARRSMRPRGIRKKNMAEKVYS